MKKTTVTIGLTYEINETDHSRRSAETLFQDFQLQFEAKFPSAKVVSTVIHQIKSGK